MITTTNSVLSIDGLALGGDPTARSILEDAAQHLVTLAQSASTTPQSWCHAGSVFDSQHIVDSVTRHLGPPSSPAANALAGGLKLAAIHAGWDAAPI